jgi:hypothetical protein
LALVGDQSRSGPDQEELQAQENGTNRSFEQTSRTLVPQVLVHFNPLQWDVAEGGTSLNFKVESSYGQTLLNKL